MIHSCLVVTSVRQLMFTVEFIRIQGTLTGAMSKPYMNIQDERDLCEQVSKLRAIAKGLRLGSDSPSVTADARDEMRKDAAGIDRQAEDIVRTIAASRDAERAVLQQALDEANRRLLNAHREGTMEERLVATEQRADALHALTQFNLRTHRMVPFMFVTH